MSEPADDTPQPAQAPRPERDRLPHSYYDDDATGYEIFHPEASEEDDDDGQNDDE